jgi:hypothetical protein
MKLIIRKIYEGRQIKATQGCVEGFDVSAVEP